MVVISSTKSGGGPVMSGVPPESILGPIVFNIFIHDQNEESQCTLNEAADDTKLGGVDGTPEGPAVVHRSNGWTHGLTETL